MICYSKKDDKIVNNYESRAEICIKLHEFANVFSEKLEDILRNYEYLPIKVINNIIIFSKNY